jgi:hypothetical protein
MNDRQSWLTPVVRMASSRGQSFQVMVNIGGNCAFLSMVRRIVPRHLEGEKE